MRYLQMVVRIVFYCSVWLSIIGGAMIFNHPDWIILNPEEFNGPVENNLLFMGGYLSLNQLILFFWKYINDGSVSAMLMGLLFFLVAGGSWFYADVNGIPLNDMFPMVCMFIACTHCLPFLLEYQSERNA